MLCVHMHAQEVNVHVFTCAFVRTLCSQRCAFVNLCVHEFVCVVCMDECECGARLLGQLLGVPKEAALAGGDD